MRLQRQVDWFVSSLVADKSYSRTFPCFHHVSSALSITFTQGWATAEVPMCTAKTALPA